VQFLHSDNSLMPKRMKAWSSWNFLSTGAAKDFNGASSVTYWMNRLQGIDISTPVFVTLNPITEPNPDSVYAEFNYAHPIFNGGSFQAQQKIDKIQGEGGVWYAGAWLGYGFHEDGLTAGLRVASALGAMPIWARNIPPGLPETFTLRAAE
jgi:predicted NAD/FAD-binding protein